MPNSLLAVVGPTASGKTKLALQLARQQNAELLSVDSRQVYRYLSAGTAKPAGEWTEGVYRVEGVPYHLADIWDPDKPFSAADFVVLANEKIKDVLRRKKKLILVGGTGLYFKALAEGLAPLPPRDESVRTALRERADREGRAALHAELAAVDPEAAKHIPVNNIARLVRALEVHRLTGKTITVWHREHQARPKPEITLHPVGIAWTREELNERIAARCRQMLAGGMIEETEKLLHQGFAPDCPALTGLGYPWVVHYLQKQISKEDLLKHLVIETRQYAKRQGTWFRHQMDVTWQPHD